MAEIYKVQMEDENGNIHYPHTTSDVVFMKDGNSVEQTIKDLNDKKHTHSNKSVVDKLTQGMLDKLAGIATGAEVNVQPDWSVTDTASDAYIKNKPTSMPANGGEANTAMKLKTARTINGTAFDGSKDITIEANTPIKQLTSGSLDDVMDFGDYYAAGSNSVTGKPGGVDYFCLRVLRVANGYIGQELDANGRKWSRMCSGRNAWSGWVEFFSEGHKPAWGDVTGKPSTFPPATHTHTASQITQDATHRFSTDVEKAKWNEIDEVKQSLEKYASITVTGELLNLPGGGDITVTGEVLFIPLKI